MHRDELLAQLASWLHIAQVKERKQHHLHVKGKSHSSVKVWDEDFGHVLDEVLLIDEAVVVDIKHLEKSVIYYAGQVAILDESDLIELLFLYGSRGEAAKDEVLVEILEVGIKEVFDELRVTAVDIEVLNLNVVLYLWGKHFTKCDKLGLRVFILSLFSKFRKQCLVLLFLFNKLL